MEHNLDYPPVEVSRDKFPGAGFQEHLSLIRATHGHHPLLLCEEDYIGLTLENMEQQLGDNGQYIVHMGDARS
eukprot:8037985-Heterocapsa_arctica.AAC.1